MTDPAWPARLVPGMRVVVRYRIAVGATDALGELLHVDARAVVVQTRRGEVTIDLSAVVAAKEIPPPPVRRGLRP